MTVTTLVTRARSSSTATLTRNDLSCSSMSLLEASRFGGNKRVCDMLTRRAAQFHAILPSAEQAGQMLPLVPHCAVVGRAPSLRGASLGSTIDSAYRVIRTNRFVPAMAEPITGPRDFGNRTDVDVLNAWMLRQPRAKPYLHMSAKNCSYLGRTSGLELYNPAGVQHLHDYLACARAVEAPVWLLHPQLDHRAASLIKAVEGRASKAEKLTFPTHGFLAAVFAGDVCEEVRLYGFDLRSHLRGSRATTRATAYSNITAIYGTGQGFWATGHKLDTEHRALAALVRATQSPIARASAPAPVREWLRAYGAHAPRVVDGEDLPDRKTGAGNPRRERLRRATLGRRSNTGMTNAATATTADRRSSAGMMVAATATSSSMAATAASATAARMAMCITGEHRNVAEDFSIDSIIDNLIGVLPLRPDIFVWTTQGMPNGTRLEQRAMLIQRASDMSAAAIQKAFSKSTRALGGWDGFGKRRGGGGIASCGHHSLCGFIRQVRTTFDCWRAVQAHEDFHGFKYTFVGRARLDMMWYGALGPAAWPRVQRGEAVIPIFDDFGGVNDRFVLARRHIYDVYARLYEDLRLARPPWNIKVLPNAGAAEQSLKIQLKHAAVKVAALRLPICLLATASALLGERCAYCKKMLQAEALVAVEMLRSLGAPGCEQHRAAAHFCRSEAAERGTRKMTVKCVQYLPQRKPSMLRDVFPKGALGIID